MHGLECFIALLAHKKLGNCQDKGAQHDVESRKSAITKQGTYEMKPRITQQRKLPWAHVISPNYRY